MKRFAPLALSLLLAAAASFALELGDSAPKISPDEWVTGDPADPTKTDGKTFYLVEVWSVTCPPCVQSIPILNGLQKKYADQGFKIVSFTSDDIEQVKTFLHNLPIEYSSFIDKEGATYINYMAADNRNTIPHAFLFDRTGAMVWTGNPLDNLEARIRQVLSGELNRDRALAIRDNRERLQDAFGNQNVGEMLKAIGKLETLDPGNGQYYQLHHSILTELGAGDEKDVQKLLTDWYKGSQDQVESLMLLSLIAMEKGHPDLRNPELALAAARRAYALGGPERIPAGMNLADMYKTIGRLDLAVKVIDELIKEKDVEPDDADVLSAIRNYYGRLLELGKDPDAEPKV